MESAVASFYYFAIFLMIGLCYGLYEDQVGLFDWKHKSVGTPKQILIDHSSPAASKRIFIITEQNVLAALNARTGQIVWRKVFEPDSGIIYKLILNANSLLTVSGQSKVVRAWDSSKGNFLWESNALPSKRIDNQDVTVPDVIPFGDVYFDHDSEGVLLSNNKYVKLISKYDGSDIWEYGVKETYNILACLQNEKLATIISLEYKNSKSFIILTHLDIETGKLVSEKLVVAPWLVDDGVTCVLSATHTLVCLHPRKNFLSSLSCSIDAKQGVFYTLPLENFKISLDEKFVEWSLTNVDKHHIEAKIRSDLRILVKIENEEMLNVLKIERTGGLFTSHSLPNTDFLVSLNLKKNSRLLNIDFYNAEGISSEPLQKFQTSIANNKMLDTSVALPVLCSLHMYKMKEDFSFRILLVLEDFSISMLQSVGNNGAKILWRREESLATVTNTKVIELPPAASAERLELLHAQFSVPPKTGVLSRFINRVKSQIRQIQTYAEQVKKQRQSSVSDESTQSPQHVSGEDSNSLTRDQFNIQKIILINTGGRRLFAIRSQNGREIWSAFLPGFVKNSKISLIEQRSTAHFPLPPQTLLLGKCDENWMTRPACKTVMYAFNPVTGEGLSTPVAVQDFQLLQISVLPFEDEKSVHVVGMVDTQLNFHIFPDTPNTRFKLSQKLNSLYIYLMNTTDNLFKGYQIRMEKENKMVLIPVWSVKIPTDQNIVQLSSKRSDEVVNSVGRVLGDHTVLYKYLNPNLVALMTVQGEGAKGSLFVYIIDAVTGHIVYNVRHKGGEEPLDLILSEHWLIYLYYNAKAKRNEVSVVEMYEGYEEKNHTAFSSLDPIEPTIILSQSYILPVTGVKSMVATSTERGITNKNILFGLSSGYVVAVPKMFLDPRREFKQTKLLQEEGVPPYMPELPIFPQAFVNYNKTVDNIRGIHTAPAGLESTSLVLVYGLDLFYTRVTPSKMFDVLKEDFDYIFISGVLSALILVSFLCSKLAAMKNLRMAWT